MNPQPCADDELAAYQAELLDILYRGVDGRDMAGEIAEAAGSLSSSLGPLDADLVAVAARLTRQWGRLR